MILYFLRHGKAADFGERDALDDYSRALTDSGIAEMRAEAKALERIGFKPDAIFTSPLVRARQTAEIVAERMGLTRQLVQSDLLAPGCDLKQLRKLLSSHESYETILLVGHEPDISGMVGELVGGAGIEMKKGSVAAVTVDHSVRSGSGILQWLVPPKILVQLGQ